MPTFNATCVSPAGEPYTVPIEAPSRDDAVLFANARGYKLARLEAHEPPPAPPKPQPIQSAPPVVPFAKPSGRLMHPALVAFVAIAGLVCVAAGIRIAKPPAVSGGAFLNLQAGSTTLRGLDVALLKREAPISGAIQVYEAVLASVQAKLAAAEEAQRDDKSNAERFDLPSYAESHAKIVALHKADVAKAQARLDDAKNQPATQLIDVAEVAKALKFNTTPQAMSAFGHFAVPAVVEMSATDIDGRFTLTATWGGEYYLFSATSSGKTDIVWCGLITLPMLGTVHQDLYNDNALFRAQR